MVIFMVHTCVQREVLLSDITFKIFFFTAASAADSYLELLIFLSIVNILMRFFYIIQLYNVCLCKITHFGLVLYYCAFFLWHISLGKQKLPFCTSTNIHLVIFWSLSLPNAITSMFLCTTGLCTNNHHSCTT